MKAMIDLYFGNIAGQSKDLSLCSLAWILIKDSVTCGIYLFVASRP